MRKHAYGTLLALVAAMVLAAGTPAAFAQGWSWNGIGTGTWSVSQPSSGWSTWQAPTGGSYRPVSYGGWSWQGTGSGWWSPATSTPTPSAGQPQPEPEPEPQPEPEPVPPTGGGTTSEEQYLVDATNAERAANGRAALRVDGTLTDIARTKARDMAVNGYFDHISPTYGSPKAMMLAAGLNPKYWGENIARGGSVEQIHQAFMESPGHRANILSAGYTHMGAGVVRQGGRLYVAEEFMQPR